MSTVLEEVGIAAKWVARVLVLLPELVALWNARKAGEDTTEAQLALVRKIEDEQAKEELGGG